MTVSLNEDAQKKLDERRKKEEEDLVVILSQKYGIAHADLNKTEINTEAVRLIPEKEAREAEVIAFQKKGKNVAFALRTPNSEPAKKIAKKLEEEGYKLIPHMVSQSSLEHAWDHYKDISFAMKTQSGILDVSDKEISELYKKLSSINKIRDEVSATLKMDQRQRTSKMIEVIVAGALANKASDIHVEPGEDEARLRYRLDGVLVDISSIDKKTYESLSVRVKLLSGLKINITQAPQDGRFSIRLGDSEIEVRTSILPGGNGESLVLRLLDPHSIGLPLEELGVRADLLEKVLIEIEKPNGMILNTGPTGSGKTTMLYAFMKKISTPEIKILTIEDPIEYHLDGIVQTQVNHKDYTFASGLRSALRQDPDVIMVGEIRDEEVATTAIHAALTGHMVFSTLHTNNAAGAFPRLIDIGIQASMVASAVNTVMAQRLLRRLSPEHKREIKLEGKDKEFIEKALDKIQDKSLIPENIDTVWVPDENIEDEVAYKGRIGVYEAIFMTKEIESAIRKDMTIREIEDVARTSQGFMSMLEDGILRVLEGITTVDEVYRVLGKEI